MMHAMGRERSERAEDRTGQDRTGAAHMSTGDAPAMYRKARVPSKRLQLITAWLQVFKRADLMLAPERN